MTFLEAKRVVDSFAGGEPLRFLLAMSGTADALDLFVRAAAARRRRSAEMRTLPFNTLAQRLVTDPAEDDAEVFLLVPWDFVPELDWRSGLPSTPANRTEVRARAEQFAARLASRRLHRVAYLPAAHLPLFADPAENSRLSATLLGHAEALGAHVLTPRAFSLGTYLASGCPIAASALGEVAEVVVSLAERVPVSSRKLLVTDFDNVLWGGVVAEDGLPAVVCGPEGAGYRHFLYQTLLLALKNEGTLIAGVSRNNEDDALAPVRAGLTLIGENDFVATLASYHPKSAQVRLLTKRLNLGLDAVAFVDDNLVELAEVASALPEVACVAFPASDEGLPAFLGEVRRLFARTTITAEDRERTQLYRRRASGLAPTGGDAGDVRTFLEGLAMRLTVHDRTADNRDRALQLINKTNQLNINGRRLTEAELTDILSAGGRLYTATLVDRTGTHGEILSCLISREAIVEAFVVSCRVFQRQVEHGFVSWLARHDPPAAFRFIETPRNEPARRFFDDPAFLRGESGLLAFDAERFLKRHEQDLILCGVGAA